MSAARSVAFIGLGNMGLPMAANLVRAGFRVCGYDLMQANCDAAAAAGVVLAGNGVEAARDVDCVITMLPAGEHVLGVYRSGVLEAASPGAIFIDCSTIDVASARAAHGLAAAAGRLSLDCPVSGGVGGAAAGTLTLMVGGSLEALEAARPLLAGISKRIVHCGEAGNGQAAKICNNMILGISMIAVAEAFVLGEKLGLSHQALYDVASTASGQCWALTSYCPVPGPVPSSPANDEYKPGFAAALMSKDLELARRSARDTGAALDAGRLAADVFQRFVTEGHGGDDFSAIITAIRDARV
jgi:3-hydroxyisobutyrate dehydrogenase